MKAIESRIRPLLLAILTGITRLHAEAWETLRAHPENPRLLEFRGKPAVLLTYGEHYGSVINSDFEFIPYLDTLQRDGMNLTRAFLMGFRVERKDARTGPLAPTARAFVQPWMRVSEHGNALDGLGKWDFTRWNEEYFSRLKSFVKACGERGIVAELTLFCTLYDTEQWQLSPFNTANNVQGFGPHNRYDSMRPFDQRLLEAQAAALRRIVREVNEFDNLYFEIQNEPFWNDPGVADEREVEFHHRMLAIIRGEEAKLKNHHLVAHNFPQRMASLKGFDVINEHYPDAVPEACLAGAAALLDDPAADGKILALDETDTTSPVQNRLESWMFVLGGGAIYNALDVPEHVYTVEDESGIRESGGTSPGARKFGKEARGTLKNLHHYLKDLPLVALRRDASWISGGTPAGAAIQSMAAPRRQYVAYFHHGRTGGRKFQLSYDPIDSSKHRVLLVVKLDKGKWRAVWTRPADLTELHVEEFIHDGGKRTLNPVDYHEDVALRIERSGD